MRMCYLSISHTNVFSVTVPPRRLQEGSGALIKGAFAGQECGLLHPGVTGAGCLLGRASAQMASRGLRSVAAEPGCNEAFPLHRCASSEPPAPPLAQNTRVQGYNTTLHTHLRPIFVSVLLSSPSVLFSFLLPTFRSPTAIWVSGLREITPLFPQLGQGRSSELKNRIRVKAKTD